MADKKDAGPPPLEDPNSPDYVCVTCHNRVNSLCLACQEMVLLRADFIRNERDRCDRYTPQPMSDSDKSDSAYDADTISDSPSSSSSTLQLNLSDNSNDENDVIANNVHEEGLEIIEERGCTVINVDEYGLYLRYPSTIRTTAATNSTTTTTTTATTTTTPTTSSTLMNESTDDPSDVISTISEEEAVHTNTLQDYESVYDDLQRPTAFMHDNDLNAEIIHEDTEEDSLPALLEENPEEMEVTLFRAPHQNKK